MASPTDEQMTISSVSILANLGQKYSGVEAPTKTLDDIRKELDGLQSHIGAWSVVWGPAIWSAIPWTTSDTILFVAQQASTNHYIIAVAGMNPGSWFHLPVDDRWVTPTMPWGFGDAPRGAAISACTWQGLVLLLNTAASAGTPHANVKLVDFLKAESGKGPLRLSVSGHSLGGALAPILALFLQNTKDTWDQSGASTLRAMSVAGPTLGNDIFAAYLSETVTTVGIHNARDAIPTPGQRERAIRRASGDEARPRHQPREGARERWLRQNGVRDM
jgi:hypothetical protein